MIENGIRGGMSMISHRHSKANNKYMKDYDEKEESKYIYIYGHTFNACMWWCIGLNR